MNWVVYIISLFLSILWEYGMGVFALIFLDPVWESTFTTV